ncbi:hypothetical protein [Actinoplanes sp. NPDC051851]|uniref:HdeD family acid-resistance protein n=1 Tax=Actinoplanes sp. NPDC051851 TaxID=3154753 RepID=UPI0034474036
MLWSGSSPLTVARGSMWAFLMFAAAAWLVIGWSVLRLEPSSLATVAAPIVLFGAVCEGLRALAGLRTWWLNAGLAGLFTLTGLALLADGYSTWTTPASLIGWYLLVRGAVDVAVGILTRGSDRVWSLIMWIGVAEAGLGFFAASPIQQTARSLTVTLGALGVMRGVADLVTALRLREMPVKAKDVLELPPERAAGLTGYSAGMTDYEKAPATRARHRARETPLGTVPLGTGPLGTGPSDTGPSGTGPSDTGMESFHERVVRTTAELDSMLSEAGIEGPRAPAGVPSALSAPAALSVAGIEGARHPAGTPSVGALSTDKSEISPVPDTLAGVVDEERQGR